MRALRSFLKDESGFSLLEIVLSMTIIVLVSGFILGMFVVSANANRRAKDTDMAALMARDAIESLKSLSSAESLEIYAALAEEHGGVTEMYRCYDRDWAEIPMSPKGPVPENAAFLRITAARDAGLRGGPSCLGFAGDTRTMSEGAGRLYEITSAVYAVDGESWLAELAGFGTKKYFSLVLGGADEAWREITRKDAGM